MSMNSRFSSTMESGERITHEHSRLWSYGFGQFGEKRNMGLSWGIRAPPQAPTNTNNHQNKKLYQSNNTLCSSVFIGKYISTLFNACYADLPYLEQWLEWAQCSGLLSTPLRILCHWPQCLTWTPRSLHFQSSSLGQARSHHRTCPGGWHAHWVHQISDRHKEAEAKITFGCWSGPVSCWSVFNPMATFETFLLNYWKVNNNCFIFKFMHSFKSIRSWPTGKKHLEDKMDANTPWGLVTANKAQKGVPWGCRSSSYRGPQYPCPRSGC